MSSSVLVIIPAHNESGTIEKVIAGVMLHSVDVLVVDDGSTDDTAARVRRLSVDVLTLTPNRGKGIALQEGFYEARRRGYSYVVTLDADLEHDPSEIPLFLEAFEHGHDMVIGERRVFRSGMRKLLNRFANFWYRCIDSRITDTICGFRGFRTEAVADLDIRYGGFEFEQLVLLEGFRRRLRVCFVPVSVRTSAKTGVTALDLIRSNDAFDRWVLDNIGTLPVSRIRRWVLMLAARAGLIVTAVLRRFL